MSETLLPVSDLWEERRVALSPTDPARRPRILGPGAQSGGAWTEDVASPLAEGEPRARELRRGALHGAAVLVPYEARYQTAPASGAVALKLRMCGLRLRGVAPGWIVGPVA